MKKLLVYTLIGSILLLISVLYHFRDSYTTEIPVVADGNFGELKINKFEGWQPEERLFYYLSPFFTEDPRLKIVNQDGIELENLSLGKFGSKVELGKFNPDGSFIFVVQDQKLVKIDRFGNLVWEVEGGFHHDFTIHDGKIFALDRNVFDKTLLEKPIKVLADYITVIKEDTGEILNEIAFDILFQNLIEGHPDRINEILKVEASAEELMNTKADIFHANSLEIIPCPSAITCKYPETFLLSLATLDTILMLSLDGLTIDWMGSNLDLERQHQPIYLGDNQLLVLDNGVRRNYSIVKKIDLMSNNIVWEYSDPKSFYTSRIGGLEKLANGNYLVTSGMQGRVFELNEKKQILWEAYIPIDDQQKNLSQGTFYRANIIDLKVYQKINYPYL